VAFLEALQRPVARVAAVVHLAHPTWVLGGDVFGLVELHQRAKVIADSLAVEHPAGARHHVHDRHLIHSATMGFLSRARQLLGLGHTPLVDFPERYEPLDVDKLKVHTAKLSPDTEEKMVIVTTSAAALERIAAGGTVQLRHEGERDVTFVPVEREAVPVLDPKLGWIIPVTPAMAAELAELPKGPGEHELSALHLGLILE